MQSELLIIIASILLYIGFGIIYVQQLRTYSAIIDNRMNGYIATAFVILWPAIFAIFVTWRLSEPLTKSRRKDWE